VTPSIPKRRRRAGRPAFRLRPATLADADLLVRHRIGMWRDIGNRTPAAIRAHAPVYRRWMLPRMRSGAFVAFVAESGGSIAGSGAVCWMEDHPRPGVPGTRAPYILSMYTEPPFRGRGVATAIVRALERVAREGGAIQIHLHASPQGRPVYTSLGYTSTNEMRRWLRRPRGVTYLPGSETAALSSRGPAGSRRSGPARSGTGRPQSRSPRRGRSARRGRS
jgi:GNAT superfamily N-acetyltransferase